MNEALLIQILSRTFRVPVENIDSNFAKKTTEKWDSVTHMMLVVDLERSFKVMLSPREIISINSYMTCKEVLKKHAVQFE